VPTTILSTIVFFRLSENNYFPHFLFAIGKQDMKAFAQSRGKFPRLSMSNFPVVIMVAAAPPAAGFSGNRQAPIHERFAFVFRRRVSFLETFRSIKQIPGDETGMTI